MQKHLFVHLSPCMLVLAICACAPAHAEAIYSFTDEHGVVHLSNIPSDPRYQVSADLSGAQPMAPEQIAQLPEPEELPAEPGRFTPITITPAPPEPER
jgi:hypothetical protein